MGILKKIFRFILKALLWLLGFFMLVFGLIWVILKVPPVQNYLVTKATGIVSKKTHTRVELGSINIGFPKSILLQELFLDDINKDTLLYLKELEIDIDMLALIHQNLDVNYIGINGLYANLKRDKVSGKFNFQFLADAFSKKEKEKIEIEDTSSSPWGITARKFEVKNSKFSLTDSAGGIFLQTSVHGFLITVDQLDLKEKNVEINDLIVSGVKVTFTKGISVIPDTARPGSNPWNRFSIQNMQVNNTGLQFKDEVNRSDITAGIGQFRLEMASLDLMEQIVKTKNLEIAGSSGIFSFYKEINLPQQAEKAVAPASKSWSAEISSIRLDSNNFKLDYTNVKKVPSGVDFNHLAFTGISAEVKKVLYQGARIKSNVLSFQAQEKSGFGIKSLKTDFEMDSGYVNLNGFELLTNRSRIGNKVNLTYSSIDKITEDGTVQISLVDNVLSVEDLLALAPQLSANKFIGKNKSTVLNLDMKANGTVKDLKLENFVLTTASNTIVDLSGNIKNVTDPRSLYLDLNVKKLQSGNSDLKALLPDSIIPNSITLPPAFLVRGKHKGGVESFISNLSLTSSYGNALLDSDIKHIRSTSPEYNIKLTAKGFNVGKVIRQPSVGPVSGVFKIKGKGFDKDRATANAEMAVKSVTLQNYAYKNISLKTSYNKGLADILADINDTNLAMSLTAKANIIKGQEAYTAGVKLKGIDLYGLNFTKEHIQVSALLNADFQGDSRNHFKGDMAVRNIMVVKNNKEYKLDSLIVASVNESASSSLNMTSSLLSADFKGNIDILSVGSTLQAHLNHYFNTGTKIDKNTEPQNFEFGIKINEDPFVREVLLPDLNDYRALTIKGVFDSEKDLFSLDFNTSYVDYANFKIKDIKLKLESDKDKLDYGFGISSFVNGSLQLEPALLSGTVADNQANINLSIADKNQGNKLLLKSRLSQSGSNYRYSLLPDGFNVMNQAWEVSPENYIEFGKKHLYVHEMNMSNGTQSLKAASTANSASADLLLSIRDFKIRTLSQIAESNDSLFKGTVNGNVTLKNYQQKMAFTSDLTITDLHYKTSAVGDLQIKAGNVNSARYDIQAILSGMGNDVKVSGFFNPQDTAKALDFRASVKALQMASFDSFTGGELRRSSGSISGDLILKGSTGNPVIAGDIRFAEARTNVKYMNQTLYMQNESVSVTEKGIHFNNFHIRDSLNNMATVAGEVRMKQFKDVHFDLQVNSQDFMVLNTTAVQNKLYYGKVILDSDIEIKGTPQLPKISADIRISKGSQFTFAVPESKLSVDRGEGVVVFLYDPSDLHPIMMRREKQVVASPVLKGMDLAAKIRVRQSSKFKILVDPVSGDSLVVRGDADINFAIDPSGKMSLSGLYTIAEGKYKAFIEGITTKEFQLVKGSKIIWNGDPMDAIVNLQAQYNIKTPPRELMSIGGSGIPMSGDSSVLARPLNFEVYLIMEGELLKPTLSFNLDMADNQKSEGGGAIYAKLNEVNENEAERNKQVFSLLVLNKFMASNAPGGGTTASGFARSSVSRMMSDQINQLSSQYLKGVEVNVDLQSYDYSQGGQTRSNTQANVSVKKNFDRLSVQVGSNVMLEGANASQSNAKNFTGDLEVAYKLTKDGRYQAKAFRQNESDGIANGVITETGVGVMYTRNYNKTKELFKAPKRKKKEKRN